MEACLSKRWWQGDTVPIGYWAGRRRLRASTLLAALMVAVLVLAGCSGSSGEDHTTTAGAVSPSTIPPPADCEEVTSLFPVASIRSTPDHPCLEWIELSIGRAVQGSTGSATVWSRRTENGTALIVGAVHTLGQGWFGAADADVPALMANPAEQTGVPRLFLLRPDGSGPDSLASPWFGLYNPAIAAERNNNLMRDVLPREDFYVAVADSQKLDVSGFVPVPEPIQPGLVPIYDPSGVTLAAPTFAAANSSSLVLLLGYPNETGELTAGVGRVLDDTEAERAIEFLAEVGDPEGAVAYDSPVELIIEGAAVAGMSGGPVVDREGRLIGVMVRASDEHDGVRYVRAVRMTHVAAELVDAFNSLPEQSQQAVEGYLER